MNLSGEICCLHSYCKSGVRFTERGNFLACFLLGLDHGVEDVFWYTFTLPGIFQGFWMTIILPHQIIKFSLRITGKDLKTTNGQPFSLPTHHCIQRRPSPQK
ncbi:hypothetical protein BDZ91DRAFT_400030 [Kalaharituber pfeilii]|nr:hypothetical protein BDZ91DRAFT_400030 [Kalaharituber pfeilii]